MESQLELEEAKELPACLLALLVAPAHRGPTQATTTISEAHCSRLAQLQGLAPPRLPLPSGIPQHPGQGLPGAYQGTS